jgi:hypothetical protein
MSASKRTASFTLLATVLGLSACASAPAPARQDSGEPVAHFDPSKDPYWQDPRWDKALLDVIQSVVHDPVDATGIASPGLHATVKFTFLDGVIEYPEITASTGDPELDKLMLHQVAAAQVPRPTGVGTDQPHEFELDLEMPTPLETFESTIYSAIEYWKVYPKNPILEGTVGETTVGFDYQDGKASSIVMTISSKSKELDRSSIAAVTKATMPAALAAYAGKSLHMEVVFCYTLIISDNGAAPIVKNQCPVERNVIRVEGTRVKRVEARRYP